MEPTENLEMMLKRHFNYSTFQKGQKEIITDVLMGHNVLGILPTGSGKSLCYQLPAKIMNGVVIVVSPLISLMMDQVKQLKAAQFKEVIALNSFIPYPERKQAYKHLNLYKLIYISPELLQDRIVMHALKSLKVHLFVIDEAHCISQWGYEFRPDYLKLEAIIEQLNHPPILALSATANKRIQDDIQNALKTSTMTKHIYPIDKENISFTIKKVADKNEKITILLQVFSTYKGPTLIYFSSRSEAEDVAKTLANQLSSLRITYYHGGMENTDRIMVQQQFMNDQLDIVCCTSAFGMGINKNNIRLVIHYHLPPHLASFVQEIGRAGRDGKHSVSLMLFAEKDVYIHKSMIHKELPTDEEITHVWEKLSDLYQAEQTLSKDAEAFFQLTEVQWRFLYYQAEKHGMIANNKIIFDSSKWKVAKKEVSALKNERLVLKEQKLKEMINWIDETDCLRNRLYIHFQESYTKPRQACCINCGFSFETWRPVKEREYGEQSIDWKESLKKILFIGDQDETG